MSTGSRRNPDSRLSSSDVPQRPTNISKIADLVIKLIEIKEQWANYTPKQRRAANYVCQSARILGLVTNSQVAQARVTPTGRVFASMAPLERQRRLSYAFEHSAVGREWLAWANVNDLRELNGSQAEQFLSECATGLSDSPKGTLPERAKTLSRWLEQFRAARDQTDLSEHRPRRQPCTPSHLRPAVFEVGKSRDLVHALVQGSSRLDIATGFFTLDGYHLIADRLDNPDIRILVGGLHDHQWSADNARFLVQFVASLDRGLEPPLSVKRTVIKKIYWNIVHGRMSLRSLAARESRRLHAKVYLFDDRAAYVTSANLTKSGLCSHIEAGQLVTRREDIDYYAAKFDEHWDAADPLAEPLLRKIEQSWAFQEMVDPYLAFLRALFLLYGRMVEPERIPARPLAEFQKLIVAHIIGKFAERRGQILVSPTGTGKTVMASHIAAALQGSQIRRVLIVCNNETLEHYWRRELQMVGIDPAIITSGRLRGKSPNPEPGLEDIAHLRRYLHEDTLVIVDECHQYRTPRSNGHKRLHELLLPKDESLRPYGLLLTATPISRGLENVEALLSLTTYDKVESLDSVTTAADAPSLTNVTLPDILRKFGADDPRRKARALQFGNDRRYYPSIELQFHDYRSPMATIFKDLETLANALKEFSTEFDEALAKQLAHDDEDEELTGNLGRQANLLKTLLTRRAESSPRALVRTLERIMEFIDNRELSTLEKNELCARVEPILRRAREIEQDPARDGKLQDLLEVLSAQSSRSGVLIFSEYVDTAEYLQVHLSKRYRRLRIDLLTGLTSKARRRRKMRAFAPVAQGASTNEPLIDILIGTDAISEGVNLEDARMVINYDLPWTPLRLVQRLGRIDRPTLQPRRVRAFNYYPKSKKYRNMISHWTRINDRSADVRKFSDAEVLLSTTRDPHAFRGKSTKLYFEHVKTYEELIESAKAQLLPTSTFLQVQMAASAENQALAEQLPPSIRTSRRGKRPGLHLLVESNGSFTCIAHYVGEMFAKEVDRLVFLRALSSEPGTAHGTTPEDLDHRIESALAQWAENLTPRVREEVQVQIALWVSE